LPPALSPATASGASPCSADSQRIAARQSSSAAGNTCSGDSRYSIAAIVAPEALASARSGASNVSTEPIIQPPPWM
jgi:hypothetical protein